MTVVHNTWRRKNIFKNSNISQIIFSSVGDHVLKNITFGINDNNTKYLKTTSNKMKGPPTDSIDLKKTGITDAHHEDWQKEVKDISDITEFFNVTKNFLATRGYDPIPNDIKNEIILAFEKDASLQNLTTNVTKINDGQINVISYVNNIINNAIDLGVSDIHVEPFEKHARIRYRKDGVLQEIDYYKDFLFENYSAICARLKIISKLNIAERRLPQDGIIQQEHGNNQDKVNLRVSSLPVSRGERIVMRIMSKQNLSMPISKLGLSTTNEQKLLNAIKAPQGLILVTGPTGSGKSTTLYSILNHLNSTHSNIMTAEDPVEFEINGIGQVQVNDNIGLTFASTLRSFLRQDPEVIMLGEIRDKDTGDMAVKASLTGHLVLSSLHTNSASSTVTRLINMGIPNYLISASLSLVIAQRLFRINCTDCLKIDKSIKTYDLHFIGISKEEANNIVAKKGSGCPSCMNTGYKGRQAIHEVLDITENIKEIILSKGTTNEIESAATEEYCYKTMQSKGQDLIKEGILSIEEFRRVLTLKYK